VFKKDLRITTQDIRISKLILDSWIEPSSDHLSYVTYTNLKICVPPQIVLYQHTRDTLVKLKVKTYEVTSLKVTYLKKEKEKEKLFTGRVFHWAYQPTVLA